MPVELNCAIDEFLDCEWAIVDWADPSLVRQLQAEARELWTLEQFRAAAVGRDAAATRREEIRNDFTCWFAEPPTQPQRLLLDGFEKLRQGLNARGYLGLVDFECHYAHYPVGGFYERHLDRFRADDSRVVSAVLYLNEAWEPHDGGELRLHLQHGEPVSILPRSGRLVLFMSGHITHEVLPTRRERWSVAGWFKRRRIGATT